MEEKPRNSSIDTVGAIPWGAHFCLFYETKNDLMELLLSYFKAGLEEGISFQESEILGFQLINLLVEQIDGCIELRRDKGTEFTIWFNNIEKPVKEK